MSPKKKARGVAVAGGLEDTPPGPILCAGKSEQHVELLELERSGIRVAEYTTEFPPRELLAAKLHAAVAAARERMDALPRHAEVQSDD